MNRILTIAAAVILLPLFSLYALPRVGSLTPNPSALAQSAAEEEAYHRSGNYTSETRLDVVDVLVAYDKSAQEWLEENHQGTINDFAVRCVQKANYCLQQSFIHQFRFRLVGTVAVDVDVSALDFFTLLNDKLVSTNGVIKATGELKKITNGRETYGADIVSVLVRQNTVGQVGLGYSCTDSQASEVPHFSKWAYNVCSIAAVNDGYTMVHEIGHNMGCGHPDASLVDTELVDPGPQSYGYSAGYYFWQGGIGYTTIMGYNFGGINEMGDGFHTGLFTTLPMFSSPDISYNGHLVGDMNHDNRRVLIENYKYVARYKVSKVEIEVGPDTKPKPLSPITWYTSREEALAAAAEAGKRVLMVSGKDDCPNTMAAKDAIEHDPAANAEADNYICWYDYCNAPGSGFTRYLSYYGGEGLPLICVIDPAAPNAAVMSSAGYRTPAQIATFMNDAYRGAIPEEPDGRIAMSMPNYKSEFTYDGGLKQSLLSVCEGVEVDGTWWAVHSGTYHYTLTLPDTTSYKWEDGTDAPIVVNWTIKAAELPPEEIPEHNTDGEVKPSAPGYVVPKLFNQSPSAPFIGNTTYNGWLRGDDNSILGTVTVKTAKPGGDGNSKLTVSYIPLGQRKQTIKTVAAAGGTPVVSIPGLGSVKLGGDSMQGVDIDLQAAPDFSRDAAKKASYNAALASKIGTWTFAFNTDQGYAAFSVTVDKKGKGKLAGTLPDGTKVSVSAQGALGGNGLAIPFAFAKKGSFGFVFWAKNDGTAELSDVTKLRTASTTLTVKSWTVPGRVGALEDGGHTFVCGTTVQTFTVSGKKWTFPKNDTKAKLSFTPKTGIVKGSFNKGRTKYTVNGVVVGSTFYGSAFVKGQAPLEAWTK